MLLDLKIENFKCFQQLEIKPLAKVNLFVGLSNSGKTSVLEALEMLPQTAANESHAFRDGNLKKSGEFSRWLFCDLNERIPLRITAQRADGPCSVQILKRDAPAQAVNRGNLPSGHRIYWHPTEKGWISRITAVSTEKKSATDLARDYDRWTRKPENDGLFVEFLKTVDARLKSLRPMEHTATRMLYADIGLKERIALPMLGEGFNRLVQILGAIIGEEAEVVLIDEIENGLHWSALPKIWAGVREIISKQASQIFATTHSLECISAAVEAFKGEPKNELAVHRLERQTDGYVHCITMGEEELERMLERGWEVR